MSFLNREDEIDFLLKLDPHGWSSFFLHDGHSIYSIDGITHVFDCPYCNLITSLSDLINGKNETSFSWKGEPGENQFILKRISTEQHKIMVSIYSCDDSNNEHQLIKTFNIKTQQLIITFYFQLLKIYYLLKDKAYAMNRINDFPSEEFLKFDKLVKETYPFIFNMPGI